MKIKDWFLFAVMMFCAGSIYAQTNTSYSELETRFVKEVPDARDSAAFIQMGLNKTKELLQYSDLYQNSRSSYNNSLDPYIVNNANSIFSPDDSVSMALVMRDLGMLIHQNKGIPEIELLDDPDMLKRVKLSGDPPYVLDMLLIKATKTFGEESVPVWQVFLAHPHFMKAGE